jgi:hypothetical protein
LGNKSIFSLIFAAFAVQTKSCAKLFLFAIKWAQGHCCSLKDLGLQPKARTKIGSYQDEPWRRLGQQAAVARQKLLIIAEFCKRQDDARVYQVARIRRM